MDDGTVTCDGIVIGPGRCVLEHRGFLLLGDVVFQRSTMDGVPVALVPFDGRPVTIPLRSLQREFDIPDDSDDGRMLGLIAEALDYVVNLQPGDKLPAEVLTGEASWEPAARHLAAAQQRLRACVLRWAAWRDRPVDLAVALAELAPAIGVADADGVAAELDALAAELAFIEASRDELLGRVRRLASRLDRLRLDSAPGVQRDELIQSRRLTGAALRRISARFDDVEAQVADIVAALRRAERLRTYVRSNRDWLRRSGLAWDPVLEGWAREAEMKAPARRVLISLTYRFLAQRFMSVEEWRAAQARRASPQARAAFEW